jgi:GNAT superfamily N-acetyltransferase
MPDAAGQGLGTRLLDEAGDVTALWVLEENHVGRRFYERRGWQPDGTAQVSFGVRELRYRRR